ncbi:MAG: homocysteine S-methyltransferase family protein [Planctomycetota bacterium]
MSARLLTLLQARGLLVSDGAMGTELMRMGLPAGECPEEWNLSHASEVQRIARSYREAGSDVVLTNTFGASRYKLAKFNLASELEELVRLGVRLARRGVGPEGLVALSVGPTGEMVEPYGAVSRTAMREAFAEVVRSALPEGPDAVCIESMFSLDEAVLALEAAREAGVCVIATMTFQKGSAGYRTMMGEEPARVARELSRAGADVVGTNCGLGIDDIIQIVREMRPATKLPILVHVNAGMPVLREGRSIYPDTPEEMAAKAPALYEAGARIIGGCCGTTPGHIRAIAEALAVFRKA